MTRYIWKYWQGPNYIASLVAVEMSMNLCIRVGVLLAKNKDGHMRRPLANAKFIRENTKIKNLRILAPLAKIFSSTIFSKEFV